MSDTSTPSTASAPAAASNDNVMAAVATLPIIGLIMYFGMKDLKPLVKFYAKQSIGLTILSIITIILGFFVGIPYIGTIFWILNLVISLLNFVLWLVLLIKALQGEMYRAPVIADLVDQLIK